MGTFDALRRLFSSAGRRGQQGMALTGYALVLATFTASSLVVIDSLNENSEEFLVDTGSSIGEPRAPRNVLATIDLGNAPSTTTTTAPPTTTTAPTSSSTPSSSTPSSSTPSSSTPSSSSTVPAPTYTETYLGPSKANHSGLCLQAQPTGQLVQAGCTGNPDQTLSVQESSAGGSQLQVGGLCIAPVGSSAGDAVVLVSCVDHDANQLWTNSGGTWVNSSSGLCLDVPGISTNPGVQLIQWTCHGGQNQQFTQSG